jgi:hypothetical protein
MTDHPSQAHRVPPVVLRLTRTELLILAGSVNEALEAVEDWEFPIRVGAGTAEARALRARLGSLIAGLPHGAPGAGAPGRTRRSRPAAQAAALAEEKHMTEVVRPRDGDTVTLRPCPPWCTLARHFADGQPADADDGYHHEGAETEVPTGYPFPGLADADPTIVRAALKSWTQPLGADPGPVRIELNLGTPADRTDMYVETTPAEARAIARALLGLADTAEQAGNPAADGAPASREEARSAEQGK